MTAPHVPSDVVTLDDHARVAAERLAPEALAYFNGGAADGFTPAANRHAWADLKLASRVLRPLAGGHTRGTLLGRALAHPILLAPVAYQRLAHPHGELATAQAAAALQAGLVLSTQASVPLEDVARTVLQEPAVQSDGSPGRGPLWFQLYVQHDRGFTLELIQRAEAAGYEALVLTVDAPVNGARDAERRAGFQLPPGVSAVNLAGLPARPVSTLQPGQSALFDGLLADAIGWDDVAWLQAQTRLPLLLKGITHPDDARQAQSLGVAGAIVSNHGGRTLDTLPATAELLPAVRDAVLIGRPQVHGLAVAGALGVAHVLRLLRDELEIAMALTGCATLREIGPDVLWSGRGDSTQAEFQTGKRPMKSMKARSGAGT